MPNDIYSYVARRARHAAAAMAELSRAPRVGDVLPLAHARADWRSVRALHQQRLRIHDADPHQEPPADLYASLTEALRAVSSAYRGAEQEMCAHALAVFADSDGQEILTPEVFLTHYDDHRFARETGGGQSRRLPAPYEALAETCRRRRDARTLRTLCKDTPGAGLVCGSTNYGAFCSVRGRRDGAPASDLDFMVVVPDAAAIGPLVARLAGLPGVDRAGLRRLADRAGLFADRYDDGRTTLTHKLTLWSGRTADEITAPLGGPHDYQLSLHVLTAAVLSYLLVDSAARIERDEAGGRRTVRIYRDSPPTREDVQHSFDGCAHRMDIGGEEAELGFLRTSQAYRIDPSDRYVPGFYQSMLMPPPELLWDELDIGLRLAQLGWKLAERVERERSRNGGLILRQSFAHPRRAVFAPGIIRQLDASYPGP